MNKYLLQLRGLIVFLILFSSATVKSATIEELPARVSNISTNYYIDQVNGIDTNDGLSPATAWQSLSQVMASQYNFNPGDSILFHTDQTWTGQLELFSIMGEKELPIVISSYGEGAKPHIAGQGEKDWTIKLQNCHFTEFKGFEITNKGEFPKGWRYAIEIRANNGGEVYGTVVSHNEIHDVNGQPDKSLQQGGAILIKNTGATRSRLVDTIIEYNHIHDVVRNGIYGNYNYGLDDPFRNKNVRIRKNLIERIPGDAIVAFGLDSAIVEYNICRDFTPLLDAPSNAAAGIWAFTSTNTIIQHNQVSGHQAKHDGQAYDADFNCENTIIQYNYSFNNVGGFALVCSDGSKSTSFNINPILRYNLSIGDGFRTDGEKYANKAPTLHITGNVEGTQIYNNTFYATLKPESVAKEFIKFDTWYAYPNNTTIMNNTFYGVEEMAFIEGGSTNVTFDNNAYYGGSNVASDLNAFYGERPANDYEVLLTEPAAVQGTAIGNNGGLDFFGNAITTDKIGAMVAPSGALFISQPIVSDSLKVNAQNTLANASIQVLNLIDEVYIDQSFAFVSGENTIDISMLDPGVYWLKIHNAGLTTILKFVKVEEETEVPENTITFFDPLDNFDLTHSQSNAVIYTASPQNFNNDAGRFSRTSTDVGNIVYQKDNIINFKIDYWSWKWAGTGTLKVYGSTDGLTFEEIILNSENREEFGDRYYDRMTASTSVHSSHFNYLKVELSNGDSNWMDQIGSVEITYGNNDVIAVEGIQLHADSLEINVSDQLQLVATINPTEATNQNMTWSSDNENAMTVDQNGIVSVIGGGEATITVTTEEGNFNAAVTLLGVTSGTVLRPSNINITTTTSSATIHWDGDDNATWYTISYRLPPAGWIAIDSVLVNYPNEFTLENLQENTEYSLRIRSYSSTHSSPWVNTIFTTASSSQLRSNADQSDYQKVKVYPNPVQHTLNIVGINESEIIQIYNITGSLIKTIKGSNKINTEDLKSGVYILKNSNQTPIKFIKK